MAAGLTKAQASSIDGDLQATFTRGAVVQYLTQGITVDTFRGTYVVDGDQVVLTDEGGTQITLAYTLKGTTLTFTIVDDSGSKTDAIFDGVIWTSHPWTRGNG